MQCINCLHYGHNKRTCKNPSTSRPPKARKRGRPKKAIGVQTNAHANVQSNSDSAIIIRKEMAQVRQGYGLFISEDSENSYLRMLGSDKVIHIGGPSIARDVQVSASLSSIGISEPPRTQESGIGGV
ncbi:uncharacterized protein LOC125316173 [Rhodamnia argentea]|uniref:Uncharacterized protein LOC125316173 n=1 Tax=Rhodamnia argentea TaxID=178133 RepID=A0ABM3HSR0_9MYRT|nr:uncharacterized protein LOC125316173 [Rhodamnia argentea]